LDSEHLLDAVTAVSGSGPAYFFLLIEAMIEAGIKQGLDRDTARRLAQQTCFGAGLLAKNSDVDIVELRRRVTSPGGTTEQAIRSFEKNHFHDIVDQAMQACAERAVTLSKEFGD
jgi:pyrroline-5-carboxylate reductase